MKLNYTGSGQVDGKHRIVVFLFKDSDYFEYWSGIIPFDVVFASKKDGTVVFSNVRYSPVYVVTAYDPNGKYDSLLERPPSGSSNGLYSKKSGELKPVLIKPGQTAQVSVTFDDSDKEP